MLTACEQVHYALPADQAHTCYGCYTVQGRQHDMTPAYLMPSVYPAGGPMPKAVATALADAQSAHDAAKSALHANRLAAIEGMPAAQDSSETGARVPAQTADADLDAAQQRAEATRKGNDTHGLVAAEAQAASAAGTALADAATLEAKQSTQTSHALHVSTNCDGQHQLKPGSEAEEQAVDASARGEAAEHGSGLRPSSDSPRVQDTTSLNGSTGSNSKIQGAAATEVDMDRMLALQLQRIRQSAVMLPEPAEVLVTDLLDHRQVTLLCHTMKCPSSSGEKLCHPVLR